MILIMRADIDFKNYTDSDYEALCSFLIALNKNNDRHINWNWARLEWINRAISSLTVTFSFSIA